MANELFRAWAYGVLESKGYVTTIKSAKKMLEKERPEALRCIEAACTGWPLVIASETQLVARAIEVWDAPAVAVDEATAQLLASSAVQVFVPVTTQAVLECMPTGAGGAAGLKPLECRIGTAKTSTVGWLSGARIDGDIVAAAMKATEADPLEDPLIRLTLGWWPPSQDAAVLTQWETARREFERGHATSTVQEETAAVEQQVNSQLDRSVDELEVSVATYNAFQKLELKTLRELVQKTEAQMLETPGFGRKSLKEVKEILADLGLSLGMKL
ncbi:MAG: hypothetical protein JNM17_12765 [Archangium sp.]|nr:hypothetical protein [Archangium sp.]